VSRGETRFDRVFHIMGYSTSHEDDNSGKPSFFLEGRRCFSIGFQFKFLLWSAAQKLRILKTVCDALPTEELRVLEWKVGPGKRCLVTKFLESRRTTPCSRLFPPNSWQSLIPFLSPRGSLPKPRLSDASRHGSKSEARRAVPLIDGLKPGRPPKPSKIYIENCRIRRDLVDWMRAASS
jgi:hypothetical protein